MLVGLDLDGVCLDFAKGFLPFFNLWNGTRFREEEITQFEWYDCLPGVDKKMFYSTLEEFDSKSLWGMIPFYPGVPEALRAAYASGVRFAGITMRRGSGPLAALRQFARAEIPIEGLRSVDYKKGETKASVALRSKVLVHIEDRPKYCEQVAAAGVPVICINQRYNSLWAPPSHLPISREENLPVALRKWLSARDAERPSTSPASSG